MKTIKVIIFLLLIAFNLQAQIKISGTIKDNKNKTVPFANVYLDNVFEGANSDENGKFSFSTKQQGKFKLVCSFVGFIKFEEVIEIKNSDITVEILLKPDVSQLEEVVITAGAFGASDEKKAVILKPLDVVKTAGAQGDIYQALQTLPGVSQVADQTGLFVRGGEAYETKTIIDGTIVDKPFFGQVPDIPSRGRFDPFMFKGTLFSTGGYSAEFGQALSSVLVLNTQDLPTESNTGIALTAAGIDISKTKRWENTAVMGSFGYTNLDALFALNKQQADWVKTPGGFGGAVGFRHQTKNKGMFKMYTQYQNGDIGVQYDNLENPDQKDVFRNKTNNIYSNASYKGYIGKEDKQWLFFSGVSYSRDESDLKVGNNDIPTIERLFQTKVTLGKDLSDDIYLKFGSEIHKRDGDFGYNQYEQFVDETFGAAFMETEIKFSRKIAARVGTRSEYSKYLDKANIAPRISLSAKTGKDSQMSLAYGMFYQTPENDFLRQTDQVGFEKSSHYIMNYQWTPKNRTFRIEAYYKDYSNLLKDSDNENLLFDNNGFGYSYGADLFFRDQESIKNLDYWISYSWLDAKRKYRDYPTEATPTFVANHTFSSVFKYQVKSINANFGMTFSYATGRTYFNPNNENYLEDKTKDYYNLSINASYLTNIKGHFTVVFFSLRNITNRQNIFGYRYSSDGSRRNPVIASGLRSAFIGMFISIR